MKQVLGFVLAAVIAVGVSSVFAGEGCCGSKAKAGSGCEALGKVSLTDAQKAKLATLQAQAKRATSTSEANEIMSAGLEKILTPEQLAQCKAACEKDKPAGHCPFMGKSDKKS